MDNTAALEAKHGMRSVTMSQVAEETGIGRATLYKYFPDVEAILFAGMTVRSLATFGTLPRSGIRQAILAAARGCAEAYALIAHESHGHPDAELEALRVTAEKPHSETTLSMTSPLSRTTTPPWFPNLRLPLNLGTPSSTSSNQRHHK